MFKLHTPSCASAGATLIPGAYAQPPKAIDLSLTEQNCGANEFSLKETAIAGERLAHARLKTMNQHIPTTPFGRRPLTLAHMAAHVEAKSCVSARPVHKWQVFRDICAAKNRLGVSERALTVLNALLSFHPETVLTGEGLIVFPSNSKLRLRAHGMAEATLRRHLAALVHCGLILRRDSPNGKRYARKGRGGEIEKAFGFEITPLLARAVEFAELAERVREEERDLRHAKECVTLCRRDIIKMIALGTEENIEADWRAIHAGYRSIGEGLSRTAGRAELEEAADTLGQLANHIAKLLEDHTNSQKESGSAVHTERHIQSSNPKLSIELEPRFAKSGAARPRPTKDAPKRECAFTLSMILDACPDLSDYARTGIGNWRDFFTTVAVVRPMLGISESAWDEACEVMGQSQTAIVVAAILQRSSKIMSAGGYLRDLTRRARAGEFSVEPMVRALMSTKLRREKSRA